MNRLTVDGLSEREIACMDHLRQATILGISFAAYCRRIELDAREWYPLKQGLARRGVIEGVRVSQERHKTPARFAAVRISPAAASVGSTACRIKHPSGWVVECASLPPPAWLSALMVGDRS